jgi:hypothetical protein
MIRLPAQIVSWTAIVGTILPPLLYLGGQMTLSMCHTLMLVATIVWFVVTPFWMGREPTA